MTKSIRTVQRKMFVKWKKDAIWESRWISKWINHLMRCGRKRFVQRRVFQLFMELKKQTGESPTFIFYTILEQIAPVVEVVPRRFGRTVRSVPLLITRARRYKIAISWLAKAIKERDEVSFSDRLRGEIVDLFEYKKSRIFIWKKDVEKAAAANQAYARYRWSFQSS